MGGVRKSDNTLVKQYDRQVFLLLLSDVLRPLRNPISIQHAAAKLLGEYLGAGRVGYAEANEGAETVTVTRNHTDGLPGLEGTYRYADYGEDLLHDMQKGITVVRPDIANDAHLTLEEKKAHRILQLGATLNVPLAKEGRLLAILFVHFDEPHSWTEDEIALAEETAQRTWAAVELAIAQNKLKDSETLFKALVKATAQATWEATAEGSIRTDSPSWRAYTGQTKAQWMGYGWLDVVHPDDRECTEERWNSAVEGRHVLNSEFRICRASGGYGWTNVIAVPILREDGEIEKWVGMNLDIDDRKNAQIALQQSQVHLEAIFASAEVGLSELSADGTFTKVNDALCRILGRSRESLLELGVSEVTHPDDIPATLDALASLIQHGEPVSLDKQYMLPDGACIWANSTLSLLKDGIYPRIIAVTADISNRKAAEEMMRQYNASLSAEVEKSTRELKKSRDLLQATLDSSQDMVQVFKTLRDDKGAIIDFIWVLNNNASSNFYGNVIGKRLLTENPEVLRAGIFDNFKKVVETGLAQQYEKRYSNGQFSGWFHQSAVKLDDGLVTATSDITARKKAEEAYRTLVENMPDLVTRWDTNKRLMFTNSVFEELIHNKKEAMLGKTLLEMGRPEPIAVPYMTALSRALSGGMPVDHYGVLPGEEGDRHFHTRMVPEMDAAGKVETVLAIGREITPIITAQKALQDKNDSLNEAQAMGHTGSFYFDIITNTVSWSDELYRIMGVAAGEPLDFDTAISFYRHEDRMLLTEKAARALQDGQPFDMEAVFFKKCTEEQRTLLIKAVARNDSHGNPLGIKGIVQDITERKAAAQKIESLNRELLTKNRQLESLNSELATFNAIAANDYQSTLQSLYTNLEHIIKTDASRLSNTGRANVRKAQGAIQRLKLLTEDIVAFSRLPGLDSQRADVDLNELLAAVCEDMSDKLKERNVALNAASLPVIEGYPMLVSLLLYHLLDNAVKFTTRETIPLISVTYALVTAAEVPAPLAGTLFHQITFRDNGIGFDAADGAKIFGIFSKLHEKSQYRGSGIGLAVCKKIMDMHQGYITANSRLGEGAVFACYFPVPTNPAAPPA